MMGETAEETKFTVYEWTINNFGSLGFTGTLRSEPQSNSNTVQFELTQSGHMNKGKQKLWVTIDHVPGNVVKGDFSLIGPDGSIFWTKPVYKDQDNEDGTSVYIGVLPFSFDDLVALIGKNEEVHEDRLTLRFRLEKKEGNGVFHSIHSVFEVRTMSMKISLASILNGQPGPSALHQVFITEYPSSDFSVERVKVMINESPSSKIELMLDSDSSKKTIFFRTRMSVLHNDGSVIRTEEREEEVPTKKVWTFSDSLTRKEVVLEGLSILLQLTVFPSKDPRKLHTLSYSPFVTEVTTNSASSPKPDQHAVDALLEDFLRLHQNKDFSDLVLHCDGVMFPVHKSILSARSPVFKRMLSSDMKEVASGSVDIVDLDAPTLARFLTFIYSGSILQSDVAFKLYYAADKYQVPTLKTACGNFLSANLSIKSVCDVLSLADKHGDQRLLSKVHSFILRNYNKVLLSEEWESLIKRDSLLVSRTLTGFARGSRVISAKAGKN